MDDAIKLGKGAIKYMKMIHNVVQLLNNAPESSINKNPVAKNAERKIILFKGFIERANLKGEILTVMEYRGIESLGL